MLNKVIAATFATTIITLSFATIPIQPAYAGCSLNEKDAQLKEKYNNRYRLSSSEYTGLQLIPIAVDKYFFGGVISSNWAKQELKKVGIDATSFLATIGFDPNRHELIGDIVTFQCWANFTPQSRYNKFKPYIAIRNKFRPPISAGNFKFTYSSSIYYSNGQGYYCGFKTMEDLARLSNGQTTWRDLPGTAADYSMTYDGLCRG